MKWYPTQNDLGSPDKLERTFRRAMDQVYDLQLVFTGVAALQQTKLAAVTQQLSPAQIQKDFGAGGAAALNVNGLLGQLAQPQLAWTPVVDAVPDASSPYSQDGAMVSYNGTIYRYSDTAGAWTISRAQAVALYGLYGAIPAVATADDGLLFYATDRNVLYVVVAGAWVAAGAIEYLVRSESAARGFAVTGHPTMHDGEMMFEINTDDTNKMYLWHRKGAVYYWFVQDGSI
jgi:hypothetical protein